MGRCIQNFMATSRKRSLSTSHWVGLVWRRQSLPGPKGLPTYVWTPFIPNPVLWMASCRLSPHLTARTVYGSKLATHSVTVLLLSRPRLAPAQRRNREEHLRDSVWAIGISFFGHSNTTCFVQVFSFVVCGREGCPPWWGMGKPRGKTPCPFLVCASGGRWVGGWMDGWMDLLICHLLESILWLRSSQRVRTGSSLSYGALWTYVRGWR